MFHMEQFGGVFNKKYTERKGTLKRALFFLGFFALSAVDVVSLSGASL